VSVSTRLSSSAGTTPAKAAAHETIVGGFASVAASDSRSADPKPRAAAAASAVTDAARAIRIPMTRSATPPTTWNHSRASPVTSAAAPSPARNA
jgi:hypothetical protein